MLLRAGRHLVQNILDVAWSRLPCDLTADLHKQNAMAVSLDNFELTLAAAGPIPNAPDRHVWMATRRPPGSASFTFCLQPGASQTLQASRTAESLAQWHFHADSDHVPACLAPWLQLLQPAGKRYLFALCILVVHLIGANSITRVLCSNVYGWYN